MTRTLKDLPIGSKIKFGKYQVENESPQEIIWTKLDNNHYKDNNNSGITDHVTLLTEKIIDLRAFDAMESSNSNSDRQKYGNNKYSVSNQRQWLNKSGYPWYIKQHSYDESPTNSGTGDYNTGYDTKKGFLSNFTQNEIENIIPTTLTVAKNTVTDGGSSETVTDKVFLLSKTEVGLENENSIAEGSKFSIFDSDNSRKIGLTSQCFNNTKSTSKPSSQGNDWYWWIRTPYSSTSYSVRCVSSGGSLSHFYARYGYYGVRPALNLKSDILVSDNLDSEGCYTLVYNQVPEISGSDSDFGNKAESFVICYSVNDTDMSDMLTIKEKLDNTIINTINNAVKNQEYKVDLNSKFDNLSLEKHTVSIEVSDGQATATRTYTFTKVNGAPKISGIDENLGIKFKPFIKEYTISDVEKDLLKINIKIDDAIVKTLENQVDDTIVKLDLNEYWTSLNLGEHIVKIEVSDKYHTTIRTVKFIKKDDKIIFSTKPVETSREVRKISLTAILSKEKNDVLTVYCCNNGFDEVPTWEDCTEEYINKLPYFFKNKQKTADKWGLSIKFDLRKQGEEIAKN